LRPAQRWQHDQEVQATRGFHHLLLSTLEQRNITQLKLRGNHSPQVMNSFVSKQVLDSIYLPSIGDETSPSTNALYSRVPAAREKETDKAQPPDEDRDRS